MKKLYPFYIKDWRQIFYNNRKSIVDTLSYLLLYIPFIGLPLFLVVMWGISLDINILIKIPIMIGSIMGSFVLLQFLFYPIGKIEDYLKNKIGELNKDGKLVEVDGRNEDGSVKE